MRRLVAALCFSACVSASAVAQTSPAQMGVTPTTVPEVLQVLDNHKAWVPLGAIGSGIFTPTTNGAIPLGHCVRWGPGLTDGGAPPCGAASSFSGLPEADILVTAPSIGMASGGADNLAAVSTLMGAISPATNATGYDVLFPGVPGQSATEYYFSDPFHMTRGANYHCSGGPGYPATYLIFPPGVDGVVEDASNTSLDGGQAGGVFSSCHILTLGYGTGKYNPVWNTSVITSVGFAGDPAGLIPKSTWHVGDGIILTQPNAYYPKQAIFTVPIGTTVTAVDGVNKTITLSNPVSSYAGNSFATKGTAVFTETGSNNFVGNNASSGDTIQVGLTTYTFVTALDLSSYRNNTVVVGKDFPTSAANLVAAIMHTTGEGAVYYPAGLGTGANPDVTATTSGNTITFTSRYGPPVVNTFPSTYTPFGTSAGSFGSTHFTGANDASNCPSPCTPQTQNTEFWQLPGPNAPKPQVFKIQTTSGSSTFTVVSGPRVLQAGDVIWSDAFPFGYTVYNLVDPHTTFPYTTAMASAQDAGPNGYATATHAPGNEANLWIMPAAERRRINIVSQYVFRENWPLGLSMACNGGAQALNCDSSRDYYEISYNDFVGRWAAGDNYSTASSIDGWYSNNYFADVWEGGTLGEIYVNPFLGSGEAGTSRYGMLKNCDNQNYTAVFGSYTTGVSGCTTNYDILNVSPGGPLMIGALSGGGMGGPTLNNGSFAGNFNFTGGNDGAMCLQTGPIGPQVFGFSNSVCTSVWALDWNTGINAWTWGINTGGGPAMEFTGDGGYKGYTVEGSQMLFPPGIQLGNGAQDATGKYRMLDGGIGTPYLTPRLWGDTRLQQNPVPGGYAEWTNTEVATTTLTAAVAAGDTVVHVSSCPPAIRTPTYTWIIAQSNITVPAGVNLDQGLNYMTSCSSTTLTLAGGSAKAVANGATLQFLQWMPAGHVANDQWGYSYPVGTMTDIATLIANSPCLADANIGLAVVSNGQTAAAAGYNAAVSSGSTGSTRRLVFCDGTGWTYH